MANQVIRLEKHVIYRIYILHFDTSDLRTVYTYKLALFWIDNAILSRVTLF